MSGPSQYTFPKADIWKHNNRHGSASKSISDVVLDPVMVEEAWARIRSYLPKDVKFQNVDMPYPHDKENMKQTATGRHVDDGKASKRGELVGGKAADEAWKFIRENAARAALGVRLSTNIDPTARPTKAPTNDENHAFTPSTHANQQPSSDIRTERVSNDLPEPIPFSNRLSFGSSHPKSDRRCVERRRRFVGGWVGEQQQRLQERLGLNEDASEEVREFAGVENTHGPRPWRTVFTSGYGERLITVPWGPQVQHTRQIHGEELATDVLPASREPLTIEGLRKAVQRTFLFDPWADEETVVPIFSGKNLETEFASAAGSSHFWAASLSRNPTTIPHVIVTAAGPESTAPHLEMQSNSTGNLGSNPANVVENTQTSSAQVETLDIERMALGSLFDAEEGESANDAHLSTEESDAEVADRQQQRGPTPAKHDNTEPSSILPAHTAAEDPIVAVRSFCGIPKITENPRTDRTSLPGSAEVSLNAKLDGLQERPGSFDHPFWEITRTAGSDGNPGGTAIRATLPTSSLGKRIATRTSSVQGQYLDDTQGEDHATHIPSRSRVPVTINSLGTVTLPMTLNDDVADVDTVVGVPTRGDPERESSSTAASRQPVATTDQRDLAIISHGGTGTAVSLELGDDTL